MVPRARPRGPRATTTGALRPPAGPPPLDVVFLIHSLEVGGARRTVATTAAAWPERRRLIVAALDGPLAKEAAAVVDARIISSESPSMRGVVRFMLAARRIAHDDRRRC